ncbi:MAG TPA: hypothetical protein VJB14_13080 [Planctomycetota bacterium]|nr:hypothetical protein [Planctomycetota bacterium]
MADAKDSRGAKGAKGGKAAKGGSSNLLFWVVFLLGAGISAGAFFLYRGSERARTALADALREYEQMQELKKIVARKPMGARPPSAKESAEDILPFLGRKGAAAGIPQSLFNVARNNPQKQGSWTETSYTVTLRGTKEAPIPRSAVADFLVAVEKERPSIKSKNLSLTFAPSSPDLSAVSVTFSQFVKGD